MSASSSAARRISTDPSSPAGGASYGRRQSIGASGARAVTRHRRPLDRAGGAGAELTRPWPQRHAAQSPTPAVAGLSRSTLSWAAPSPRCRRCGSTWRYSPIARRRGPRVGAGHVSASPMPRWSPRWRSPSSTTSAGNTPWPRGPGPMHAARPPGFGIEIVAALLLGVPAWAASSPTPNYTAAIGALRTRIGTPALRWFAPHAEP